MLNDETGSNISTTRALGASTPTHHPVEKSNTSESERFIRQFLQQEGCLDFGHQKEYYAPLKEEKDDDEVKWYPMYISYSREKRAKTINDALTQKGYETYLHLQEVPRDQFGNPREDSLQGPLYSMVFVRAMKIQLKLLKRYAPYCHKLKFVTRPYHFDNERTTIIWIPQRQMENFIKAATATDPDGQRIPLTYNEFIGKEGTHVRIASGPFMGIEGEIKRVGRHRIVVVPLRDAQIALGITHIPPEDLEFI